MLNQTRCVILNASYEPLSVVSAKRGLILVLAGKAVISEKHPTVVVHSPTKKFPLPTQVRLKDYIKSRPAMRAPATLTQRNLFIRDKYTCQYCGRTKKELKDREFLTRDHIHPTCRGGKDIWTNVITACIRCNNKKGEYTMEEARKFVNMTLLKKPNKPTVFEIWARTDLKLPY